MDSNKKDLQLLVKAVNFAAICHTTQMRKDGSTPYINHPIGVMHILSDLGDCQDVDVLCAAVLHDTVEDCDMTIEGITKCFGPKISSIVAEVTDDKSLPKEERKRLQVLHSPNISFGAKLVKLSDKIYNLRDLLSRMPNGWTDERVQEYFEWAKDVISGMIGTNDRLENELKQLLAKRNVSLNSVPLLNK